MNYRRATILAEETLSSDGTKTIGINIKQPISRIDIRFRVTKASHNMAIQAAGDVQKIELVDGSEVLHSLSGLENQALCIYDRKCPTMNHGQHLNANAEESEFGIDFGRYLYDPELAFDPTRYRNPQLKVTYTRATVDTSASTAYLEAIAHCFDEKVISPMGFLMSKEQHSESDPAEDSYKYVDLPNDFPIRKLILRAEEDNYAPWNCIKGFRLDEDNEKRIPIDVVTEDYYRIMKGVWSPVEELFIGWVSGVSGNFYITPTDYLASLVLQPYSATLFAALLTVIPGGKVALAGTGSVTCNGIARGYLPNHCVEFPFGIQSDLNDWYDVTKGGSLRARVKGGSVGTGGTFQIVLQQLRRY